MKDFSTRQASLLLFVVFFVLIPVINFIESI